ncbi:hypothetical protein MNY64_06140 [Moellerella wisconsensis]|uniref:hypothetical protein n=1 Tax=Moellerella wisconsensis TaxID=158849 RepID=UPI001F4EEBD0|nr:hypothetical protein [Moellerella wisconsensis]UNH28370.1 hypothetical protein MNY64_06140 [Moellerella wisconsensis]
MKLTILRAIYFGNNVAVEGEIIETGDLHGRELIKKGYAIEMEGDHAEEQEQQEQQEQQDEKATKTKKGK